MEMDVTSLYNRRNVNRWERVSVGDTLERVTYSFPNKEAIVAREGAYAHKSNARLTYKQANDKANQFANALMNKGLNRGDRVFFFCDNSAEALIAKIGVAKAGMVAVPVNTMLAPDVISYIINLVEPKVFIADSEHWPKIESVFNEHHLDLDITIPINGKVIVGSQSFESFVSDQETVEPDVEIHGDDIWEILFTSGTTSMPKGVMISHTYTYFASFNSALSLSRGLHLEGDLKICSFLPIIFHVGDQVLPFASFLSGGTFVIGRTFDVPSVAQAITDEKVTAFWAGSPAFLAKLTDTFINNKGKYDATSLSVIFYGWAALSPEYHDKLKELCGKDLVLYELLAQTESISGYRFWHDKWPETYKKNAPVVNYVGVPNPLLASVLKDEQGEVITKPGVSGEVVYRSPAIMSGYYKNEQATREAFEGGWFHSGDSCMYDEEGLAIMIDRYKDVIKSGGENVSSIRVETVLRMHPSVGNAAVVGLPHEKWGEMVTGIVVLKGGQQVEEEELIRFCREKLASFETPKQIIYTDRLPETVGGKILKYKLRQQFRPINN
ncbi:AMP-binding protein [Bacillus sp. B15-48]|uniref:class I adenylate-forming enzyme family protein n=1 Tax=Bacillus sp. B15-48 TaxID=1548601 RepID=UPI00193EFBF2|nr:AMP-binding protein [Bacillus sp. B15-48]MBM4761431.1 AMP-binding protein [Bacillus sp. B15-48]